MELVTPLIATACTMGLISMVLLIIILDTICRGRKGCVGCNCRKKEEEKPIVRGESTDEDFEDMESQINDHKKFKQHKKDKGNVGLPST
ncbi:hypothetical protein EG68_00108 [Paragonimus skrjabini miyazakii]|uniref:Uncharacterized protein n=1 Tax=Paragonimus skrjabini miyazakii TaxID=59628 RepID=A0A8S9Z6R1_9TREM|nr:hypothetical protein EG68_00108 [Paragonimus skrjabini miyazakii]